MSRQERATRTRSALILSAAELFERHGYAKTSLNKISAGAGVSRGALHFHFENKNLVAAAVESDAAHALRDAVDRVSLGRTGTLQGLMDLSHRLGQLMRCDVVVRAGFRLNCDAERRTRLDLRQEWQACVRRIVARAADEKALASGVSEDSLATTVVAATVGFEVLSRTDREWLAETSLANFWELLLPCVAHAEMRAELKPGGTSPPANEAGPRHLTRPSYSSSTTHHCVCQADATGP